ncbi:MAG: phage holin family protein [Chthoniobacterales bacterium]
MAGEPMRFRNPAGHAGLLTNLIALLNALVGFFESRAGLFAAESKSALVHVLVLVGCLVAALLLVAFGYVFLLVSGIVAIAHAAHLSWVWVALATAVLHFVLAFVCVMIAVSRMKEKMFESTAAELKRDREWLKELDKRSRYTS